MNWKSTSTLAILVTSLMAGCGRAPKSESTAIVEESESIAKVTFAEPALTQRQQEATPAELLTDRVLDASDSALSDQLRGIQELDDPKAAAELLTTFYEQLDLRAAPVRLPLLLEMARSPHANDSFRTTLIAELGAILQADHGTSWDAWALTLRAHLADQHGILDSRSTE